MGNGRFRDQMIKCLLVLGFFNLVIIYFQDEIILQSFDGIAIMFKSNGTVINADARSIDQQTMMYCDVFNPNVVKCGEPFNDTWIPILERLNLSDHQISTMTREDDSRILSKFPTFVVAISDNHYRAARKWVIPQIRELAPNNTLIIIYDLGLNSSNSNELRKLPFVEVRKFNFSMYPAYFRDLFQFRWKPLVIAEALRQYEAVFYADAHFRWKKNMSLADLLQNVRCQAIDDVQCSYSNAVFLSPAQHSIFFATYNRTYDFLPIDQEAAKRTEMGHAAMQLIYSTKDIRANVMKWFVLCALEEECMAPNGSDIRCKSYKGDIWKKYGNCHRQDQSAISILLSNRNRYELGRFMIDFGESKRENIDQVSIKMSKVN